MLIDLADIAAGRGGFVIQGEDAGDGSGRSVAAAGDINGDGFADLIIGAPLGAGVGNAEDRAGGSYVVFGHAGGFAAAIDLGQVAQGQGGFVIHGENRNDESGGEVASAGDINGDGFDDLIIGVPRAAGSAGATYVVFGHAGDFPAAIDLGQVAQGQGGFGLRSVIGLDYAGRSAASAGDVNGDGFDDLIIGAPGADGGGREGGSSYVLFGHAGEFAPSTFLVLLAQGQGGFIIRGEDAFDQSGNSVASAGDVNGDGFDDLIVGAARANGAAYATYDAGSSYVVFGHAGNFPAAIRLGDVAQGQGGFVIHGEDAYDQSGGSVASAGDINGDGFDDVIIGAGYADGAAESYAGSSYVVFGRAGGFPAAIDVGQVAQVRAASSSTGKTLAISPAGQSPRPATSTATASTTWSSALALPTARATPKSMRAPAMWCSARPAASPPRSILARWHRARAAS